MIRQRLAISILTAFLLSTLSSCGETRVFYVQKWGNDANTGNRFYPFQSIARAVSELRAGDTLVVGPGTYHEEVIIPTQGTAEKPIVIRAEYPGTAQLAGSVRLQEWERTPGREKTYETILAFQTDLIYEKDTNTEYAEVFDVENVERNPGTFYLDAGSQRLYVHPTDSLGMSHHVVDACRYEYGMASERASRESITPARYLTIDGFVATGYRQAGIFLQDAVGCHVRNVTAHHNRAGIIISRAQESSIEDCVTFRNAHRFNQEMGNIAFMGGSTNCRILRCKAYETRQHGIRFYGGDHSNSEMAYNLAYDCSTGIQTKGTADGSKNMILHNNVSMSAFGHIFVHPLWDSRRNTRGYGSYDVPAPTDLVVRENRIADYRFADPAYHDYRFQAGSPFEGERGAAAPPFAPIFYVSSLDGNDGNPGTSLEQAWRTLRRAGPALAAHPGATLYVLPGDYDEVLKLERIPEGDSPTRVRAYGKQGAVRLRGMDLFHCTGVQIEGFTVEMQLERNVPAVAVRNSRKIEIRGNELVGNRTGIYLAGGSDEIDIVSNIILDHDQAGIEAAGNYGSAIRILNNIIWGNGTQLVFANRLGRGIFSGGFFSDYNCLDSRARVARVAGRVLRSLSCWRQQGNVGRHTITDDPNLFRSGDWLTLPFNSRLKGRGYLDANMGTGRCEKTPLVFEAVDVIRVSETSADIEWQPRGRASTVLVRFGTDENNLDRLIELDTAHFYRYLHRYTFTELLPNTRYYFQVGDRRHAGKIPYHAFAYDSVPEVEDHQGLHFRDEWDAAVGSFVTAAAPVEPRVYHVDARSGHDSNGGTENAPFQTLRKACDLAGPGDRVIVHGGLYEEMLSPRQSGTPDAPIEFLAAGDGPVYISGKNLRIPAGADLVSRHHITLRGFTFREHNKFYGLGADTGPREGTLGGDILVIGASNIRIEDCVFDGQMNYNYAVCINRSADVILRNNFFLGNWVTLRILDCRSTITVDHNSFLGATMHKVLAKRNEYLEITNNLFGEILSTKRASAFKTFLIAPEGRVRMDYNAYYFWNSNPGRLMSRFHLADSEGNHEVGNGNLEALRLQGFERNGGMVIGFPDRIQTLGWPGSADRIFDFPMWSDPGLIASLRERPRGWPIRSRYAGYGPGRTQFQEFTREELRLQEEHPLRGRGENGSIVGAD